MRQRYSIRLYPLAHCVRRLDRVKGFKEMKARITLLVLTNADGSDKNLFTNGRFKNPRCFKRKSPPLPYFHNSKAWMTQRIFHEIVKNFDDRMAKENRKVLLFVDNATCHYGCPELRNVSIQYLPPNTTSLIQPADQGIIKTLKSYYRQNILRRMLTFIDDNPDKSINDFAQTIDVLQALYLVKRAWFLVKPESISNIFRKCGFIRQHDDTEFDDEDDEPIEVSDIIDRSTFDEFCICDSDEQCSATLTDIEICESISNQHQDGSDVEDEPPTLVANDVEISAKDALKALGQVRKYMEKKNLPLESTYEIEDTIIKARVPAVQKPITDYFL